MKLPTGLLIDVVRHVEVLPEVKEAPTNPMYRQESSVSASLKPQYEKALRVVFEMHPEIERSKIISTHPDQTMNSWARYVTFFDVVTRQEIAYIPGDTMDDNKGTMYIRKKTLDQFLARNNINLDDYIK